MMKMIRTGRATAVLLLILLTLTVDAQMPGKQPAPPPEPVLVTPDELSTAAAVYIVRLEDDPLATYDGSITGLAATAPSLTGGRKLDPNSPASQAYQNYLDDKQQALMTAVTRLLGRRPTILHQYALTFNGLALELDGREASELTSLPGVISIRRDQEYQPLTDAGPAWINAPAIWEGSPAVQNKGESIIIGVIDTGLNTDHPSFADIGGDGYDHTNPWGAGVYKGICTSTPALCNDKLIGLWDFADAHGESDGVEDSTGHGSHTASTAAGNVIAASLNSFTGYSYSATISGVAPHANLIAYDACLESCPGAALLAAVDQAVADGVDVINYSISGGIDPYSDAVELAFLAANEAGVFVAAAAGNSGPGMSTLSHQSPWLTTVGATTHNRQFDNSLVNLASPDAGPLASIGGKSVTAAYGPAPVVYAGDFGDALCLNAFLPGTWSNGEIVVCDRGVIARVDKGANVLAGGAGGLVLANNEGGQVVNADAHYLPAVHINYADGLALKTWLASGSGHVAAIAGTAVNHAAANGDIMADFSSRGPDSAFDVIKPDITAPGVDVLAAINSTAVSNPPEYGLISGTSMAAPHAAGAAALLLHAHPTWTPDEIRSALMMTSSTDVRKENGLSTAVPFDRGSGRIDLAQAVQAGLVMDETKANYEAADPAVGGDPQSLNLPSLADGACLQTCTWNRTVRSTLTASTTWTVTVEAPPGMTVTVSPTTFLVPAGATQSLTITADVTQFDGSRGWGFAAVHLNSPGQAPLHMPIAVQKAYASDQAALAKSGPASARPGEIITFQIALDNLDAISHTFSLTDTLPVGLDYVPGSAAGGLVYNPAARQLTWQGVMGPGTLGYEVTAVTSPAYVNLGGVGGTDLCADPALQGDCDDGTIAFDLAATHAASYTFYGQTLDQINASTNGLLFGPQGWSGLACIACPQPLPEPAELNQLIAGLWRDIDMSGGVGQWYAAVVTGLLPNPADRVFYVNWHNAGQFGAPLTTSRNAIAVVLDGGSEPAGRIYTIYDDIAGTAVLQEQGYTIGVENMDGSEGVTYAFAPCLSAPCIPGSPTGVLPENGTVLRFDPAIVGGSSARIFTYQVQVTAAAPALLTNRVEAASDGPDPYLLALADLLVEYRSYLPGVWK